MKLAYTTEAIIRPTLRAIQWFLTTVYRSDPEVEPLGLIIPDALLGTGANDVIELPGIGAASFDLVGETAKEADIVEEQSDVAGMNALNARKTTGDVDGVLLAAIGTLDLAALGHGIAPFLPFPTATDLDKRPDGC